MVLFCKAAIEVYSKLSFVSMEEMFVANVLSVYTVRFASYGVADLSKKHHGYTESCLCTLRALMCYNVNW